MAADSSCEDCKAKKRKSCPNLELNAPNCPCTADCPRHGICCECIAAHRAKGNKPACMR